MDRITDSLLSFKSAVEQKEPLCVNNKGYWHVEGSWARFFRRLLISDNSRIATVCRVYHEHLDQLEKIPPKFNAGSGTLTDDNQKTYQDWVSAAAAVANSYGSIQDARIQKEMAALNQKIASLKYRMEQEKPVEPSQNDVGLVTGMAKEWKDSVALYQGNDLTSLDKTKIQETCRYPEFIKQLENNKSLQVEFFKWAIRDNNCVEHFIQYPAKSRRLRQIYLAQRIGRFAGQHLKIQKRALTESNVQEKVLTLPFEVKEGNESRVRDISILDEAKAVTFRGGYQTTLEKVFQAFSKKNDGPGDFEFLGARGILNWNSQKHAYQDEVGKYLEIDYLQKKWWKQLPVFEMISKEELQDRYNIEEIPDGHWVGFVKSTTESLDLDVDRCHGYMGVALPGENGTYQILDFGKFAEKYPKKAWDYVSFLGNTFRAKIEYPDSNEFYSQRQHAATPRVLTPEKGKELMVEIQRALIESKAGNQIFQFAYENCAYWPQQVFRKIVDPNLNFFYVKALKAKPSNPALGSAFAWIRKAPEKMQPYLMTALSTILNPWRGVYVYEGGQEVKKTVSKTPYYNGDQSIYCPSKHSKDVRRGGQKGVLTFGHAGEKVAVCE